MKKIALCVIIFVTVHLAQSCTPRPEELPVGDSLRAELPAPAGSEPDTTHQTDPSRMNYILPMDTTYIRDSAGFTLIKVGGPLGDGCQRFEYMDSVRDGSALKLTFWASRPKDPNVICTQQMQYVQREIRIKSGDYSILRVMLPNGKEMTRSLSPQ
jgi:hypothetical protein